MKKLLVLTVAIATGIVANAASFKWTAANIYAADGTTKYTGSAEIYAYASTATKADAVLAKTVSVNAGAFNITENWEGAVGGTTYNFFFVFEDGGKKFSSADSTPAVIKSGIAAATATTTIGFANMQSATQNANSWTAVPEPTSGLMLLLGVAGLALKRKRA